MTEFTPFGEQLDKVNVASQELILNSNQQAEELIKAGKYQEATDTLHNMLNGIEGKNTIVNSARQQHEMNVKQILGSASHSSPIASPKTSQTVLPKGISKGKTAAIAAGVAVIAGGIYLYRQHERKKRESWVTRIEREHAFSSQRGLSL